MKKTMRFAAFAAVLILFLAAAIPAAAKKNKYPDPTSAFFVNDFAGCISAQDEAEMQKIGEQLYAQTKAQLVVVSIESLGGVDIEDYAIGLAREWGIGEAEKDSGVLLLISTKDRDVRIEVGSGLEGQLTDGKTGRILDAYALPHLRNNDFSTGLTASYKVLAEEIYAEFGVEGYTEMAGGTFAEDVESNERVKAIVSIIALLFWVLVAYIFRRRGRRRGFFFGGFGGPGGFGGGFGGSGGSSGGFGGGGGFSGGGGGFSGGGSSRGF